MTLSRYIWIMLFATLVCWGAWYLVVAGMNPFETNLLGLALFYGSLTLALTGTFALIGFVVRQLLLHDELTFQKVSISFRQGIFFSVLVDGFLMLEHAKLLLWYTAAFLIMGLTVIEFFIISRKPVRRRG